MKLFTYAVIAAIISLSTLPADSIVAHAQQTPIAASRTSLVATVNIENAKIISQSGNTFKIGFDISNGQGAQTDVKYGVLLAQQGMDYVSDQVVYDEALTLNENSKVHREISYTAPNVLSGTYQLVLNSSNSNGFPFSVASVGSVTLTASATGVLIDPNSCYMQVAGDTAGTHYTLTKNIDIRPAESLTMTCTAQNQTDNSLTVTPTFDTRYFSPFGTAVPQAATTGTPVTFATKEKKSFTVQVPKGSTPDFYSLTMKLSGAASNSVYAQYIVSGVTASVQNLTLDKNRYEPGETGKILLVWSSSTGNFARTGTGNAIPAKITIKAAVTDKGGTACAAPIEEVLVRDQLQPQTTVPFSVTAACADPQVSVSLLDAKGTLLDQKSFGFVSSTPAGIPHRTKAMLIVAVILAIAGLGITLSKKRQLAATGTMSK